jgi:hypothetical protein
MVRRATTEGGWIGLVAILLALVIVAILAQTALKQYGVLASAGAPVTARPGGDAARPPNAANPSPTPIERARGVEDTVKRGAEDTARRIDDQIR